MITITTCAHGDATPFGHHVELLKKIISDTLKGKEYNNII